MKPTVQRIRIVLLVCPWILALALVGCGRQGWSEAELATLSGLWIGNLPPLPPIPPTPWRTTHGPLS